MRTIVTMLIALYSHNAWADGSVTQQGLIEFGINGRIDLDPVEQNAGYVNTKLGYLLVNQVATGGLINYGTQPSGIRESLGVFFEVMSAGAIGTTPYAGLKFNYAKNPRDVSDEHAQIYGTYFGTMLVVKEGSALAFDLNLEFATIDVFGAAGSRRRYNVDLSFGYRLFF